MTANHYTHQKRRKKNQLVYPQRLRSGLPLQLFPKDTSVIIRVLISIFTFMEQHKALLYYVQGRKSVHDNLYNVNKSCIGTYVCVTSVMLANIGLQKLWNEAYDWNTARTVWFWKLHEVRGWNIAKLLWYPRLVTATLPKQLGCGSWGYNRIIVKTVRL